MASISAKILTVLGIGGSAAGATAAGIILFPSTIAQTMQNEGYVLISSTEKNIKESLFSAKWNKYKSEATDSNLFPHSKEKQNLTLDEFKGLCSEYENSKDTSFQDRVIKWCALSIEDHVTKIGKKNYNTTANNNGSWRNIFSKHRADIKALVEGITENGNNANEKLHKWCGDKKSEPFSNKNKNIAEKSLIWCTTE